MRDELAGEDYGGRLLMRLTERTLGEVCDEGGGVIRTGPFGSQLHQSDYKKEGMPVVMPKDIVGDKLLEDGIARIGEEDVSRLSQHKLREGDIVYGRRGDIGRQALITKKEAGWLCGTGCLRIALGNSVLWPPFLHYYLRQPEVIGWIYNQAVGATMANLNTGILRSVPIKYPPLKTQRKIAAILSTYDDLIENNTRRIKILEEMAQALYREWFVNFRFPGHEQVRMVDSSLGRVPEGWEVKSLGDIAKETRRGVDPKKVEPETPYFGLEHFPRRSITLSEWGSAGDVESTKLAFSKGEILFGKIRPYFHKVAIAPLDGICSSDAIVISAKKPGLLPFVLACVSSDDFVSHATKTSQGTKMPRADWKVLVKYPVVLPKEQIQKQFNTFVGDLVRQTQNLMFKNRNLRQTRDLLLPKLISGEVEVSELDIEIKGAV